METIYKEKIGIVHSKISRWKNQLAFYKEELMIFQKWLEELSSRNRDENISIDIEQFQNKFIIQKNELDKLEHKMNVVEDNAVYSGRIHIRRITYMRTAKFIDLEKAMIHFAKLFAELKKEFYSFFASNQ